MTLGGSMSNHLQLACGVSVAIHMLLMEPSFDFQNDILDGDR